MLTTVDVLKRICRAAHIYIFYRKDWGLTKDVVKHVIKNML